MIDMKKKGSFLLFHTFSIDQTFSHFQTSAQGLSAKEVEKRKERYGENRLEEEKESRWKLFLRQFHNPLIYILFAASFVSILINEWGDFLVINCIILINGTIGYWQEKKAQSAIEALRKMTEHKTKVMREGTVALLPSRELVPGDFVIFHEGEVITADVRVVESSSLMVDESTLTGESIPVIKEPEMILDAETLPFDQKNILFTGSSVVRGMAKGVVVATGISTYLATIAKKSEQKKPDSPFTLSLRSFSRKYLVFMVFLFLSMGIAGYLQGRAILELGYILLASLVSVVPEGLPIVITLVMVLGALKLSKKKTLVRFLPSVETLGSTTIIASDKTGTITEGTLVVKEHFAKDEDRFSLIAALCNDSEDGKGDPIDVALADYVAHFETIKKRYSRKWSYPFDPSRMLMAVICEIEGKEKLLIKGAFESLQARATNQEFAKELEKKMHEMVQKGFRVLALGEQEQSSYDPDEWEIELIGIVGFLDPPKEGVKEAVASAKKAGIRVIMITGDHPLTAKEIAEEVGIWENESHILTGHEIAQMGENDLKEALASSQVIARILPEHKHAIVTHLQSRKEIVAVTGDGVNDVPALRAADLGIAMGGGTDAAKAASQMVITDNNLSVIVDAVRYGRTIADNIRKVIYYLLSTSLQEIVLISASLAFFLPIPLNAIQILWINIATDGTQDKTFALAKEEEDVMSRKPKRPQKQFFDLRQMINLLIFGMGMGGFTFFLYLHLLPLYDFPTVSSLVFTSVVTAQWANGIQAQKQNHPFFYHWKKSFTINPFIYVGMIASFFLQYIAIYLLPHLFHTVPLTLSMWKYPLYSFFASFFLVEIRKWMEQIVARG